MRPKSWLALLLSGAIIQICLSVIITLGELRGPIVVPFIFYFLVAGIAYLITVAGIKHRTYSLRLIWIFALFFRLTMLFSTPPTLSDDVYRYIWDGHLINAGINPYMYPVNSPALDIYDTPARALVNNDWMASPYLPAAQGVFALITRLVPQIPLAFQISMLLLDMITGWLILNLLGKFDMPKDRILLYLWNPLVIVEFSHGAHIDALMICLSLAAFWMLLAQGRWRKVAAPLGSAVALAGAVLTKGFPILLAPVFLNRWRIRYSAIFALILFGVCFPFARHAGWGLNLPLDGDGLFGAARIYSAYWNYNSGLYHWLEVAISGFNTPGAIPYETFKSEIRLSKMIIMSVLSLIMLWATWRAWVIDNDNQQDLTARTLALIQIAILPLGAYLLLATTIHPWYVTILVPFLPFLLPHSTEKENVSRFIWPWLYLSVTVALSYLTYMDKDFFQEFYFVRQVEYLPVYGLLIWALAPYFYGKNKPPFPKIRKF